MRRSDVADDGCYFCEEDGLIYRVVSINTTLDFVRYYVEVDGERLESGLPLGRFAGIMTRRATRDERRNTAVSLRVRARQRRSQA
jgi:hypothetical protein